MIAVLASESVRPVVREFFELFKTPWSFYSDDQPCDVLLCFDSEIPRTKARLVAVYEGAAGNQVTTISFSRDRLPIYCGARAFADGTVFHSEMRDGQTVLHIGFNLLAEVEFLLTRGQPAEFAMIPTLDLHISILRELVRQHVAPPREIAPVPDGYKFIACLTHDVDQPRLRHHFFDHTMFGFLFRALFGSVLDFARGRKDFGQLVSNYRAAFSLPFVYLGIARDLWNQFDRYLSIDAASTFFVIPFKSEPGEDAQGRKQPKRAAAYDLTDIADNIRAVLARGCEVAAHGIDAWRDARKGRAELERVRQYTGEKEIGVRMHWLYFDENSFSLLEEAGYSYDSTVGYNGAIGYRAGTSQVFKPLGVDRLLELPMHVMDTALFFPSHMNLSPRAARVRVDQLIENATRFGGVMTINWHDRSIAPERCWDQFYLELVQKLRERGAWMPTAAEAVAWFRERREIDFEQSEPARHDVRSPGGAVVHA